MFDPRQKKEESSLLLGGLVYEPSQKGSCVSSIDTFKHLMCTKLDIQLAQIMDASSAEI
jgi:hypothetical protein